MSEQVRSGDHLEDIDFEISIRSGQTDIRTLDSLLNILLNDLQRALDTDVLLTLREKSFKEYPEKTIRIVRVHLHL